MLLDDSRPPKAGVVVELLDGSIVAMSSPFNPRSVRKVLLLSSAKRAKQIRALLEFSSSLSFSLQ
jgi:hypothetical protein